MSYKQITLELDGAWVLDHRTPDKLPISVFIDACKEAFDGGIDVREMTFTECIFVVNNRELSKTVISRVIKNLLKSDLGIEPESELAALSVEELEETAADGASEETAQTGADEQAEKRKREETKVSGEVKGEGRPAPVVAETSESGAVEMIEQSLDERIASLIGADEFKALIGELNAIAPHVKKHNTYEAFAYQSYLFSINEGCGFSTCLKLFADVVERDGLFKFNRRQKIAEEKLLPPADSKDDLFSSVRSHLQGYDKSGGMLISIDISEWMNKLTDKRFCNFLSELEDHSADNIFVFKIPFVENEVLEEISAALLDLAFVRTVAFPPFDTDDLIKLAEHFLSKMGFSAEDDVWNVFRDRITEEKSDGRFYGINTVKKIVREMVYRKHISDAKRGKDDDRIGRDDIADLSRTHGYSASDGMEVLDKMVGMESVRRTIEEIIAQIELAKTQKIGYPSIHMRFVGSPGTGKTTVARELGHILKERGILRNGNFFEYAGRDFCGRYVGETAPKTASICRDAYGSVLFIDEAYSLYRGQENERDFGREALDTLIAEMENHRDDLVVIMAGYTDEMAELMKGNIGLESRMPYVVEFPSYTRGQLCEIFFRMIGDGFKYDEDFTAAASRYFDSLSDEAIGAKEFSNARFVRNLYERTCAKAGMRRKFDKSGKLTLTKEDFELASADRAFKSMTEKKRKPVIGF